MKMSYRWLTRHLPELPEPAQVAKAFVHLGIEVAAMDPWGLDYQPVQLARVLERRPHPEADHLHLVEIEVGAESRASVVTGAQNGVPGDCVWYGPPGTRLPDGRVLATAEFRGEASAGMLLSAEELGFAHPSEGLWLWAGADPIGTSFLSVLGGADTVFDLELTPNLAAFDQSAIGLARDLAAYFRMPPPQLPKAFGFGQDALIGRVEEGAPLYSLVVLEVDNTGVSPLWMQTLLAAIGQRAISPLVDVTNFVLWDLGQPLHVFDYDKVSLPIRVRNAEAGEVLVTLDGIERRLSSDDLIIADANRALALAGVMGGQESAVEATTTRVILESAHFDANQIYRTLRRHRIESDAALHFGKGTDAALAFKAPTAVVEHLAAVARPRASQRVGEVPSAHKIAWDGDRIRRLLGVPWEDQILLENLEALGFQRETDWILVPSYRPEVQALHDLAEEVLRVYGVDRVPLKMLSGMVFPGHRLLADEHGFRLKTAWAEAGYWEVITSVFSAASREAALDPDPVEAITIVNPLRPEEHQLRRGLLPGMLETVAANRSRSDRGLRLYQVAPIFFRQDDRPVEAQQLVVVQTLEEAEVRWPKEPQATIHDLKAALQWVLARVGLAEEFYLGPSTAWPGWAHPGRAIAIWDRQNRERGIVAELKPSVARGFRSRRLGVVVLNLGDAQTWTFKTAAIQRPNRYPAAVRDLSLILPDAMAYGDLRPWIEEALRSVGANLSVDYWLADRYPTSAHEASITLRFVLQSSTSTLSDKDIVAVLASVVTHLRQKDVKMRQ